MKHFRSINEAKNEVSEELNDCKKSLEKLQAENKILKQKLELAEQLSDQIQKLDINKKQKDGNEDEEANSEKPLDLINITLMRDQAKSIYKAVENLPSDIKQTIFGYAKNDSLKRFLKIQKFLALSVEIPDGMTTMLHERKINQKVWYKFITVQISLDIFPMEFDIPDLGKVGIEELFSYGVIDGIHATNFLKISFLPEKLQQTIRMFGGKKGFCLDIDSIPCEWIISQPYKLNSYLPAYHYIAVIPYHYAVEFVREESPPIECQDMCPEYLQRFRAQRYFTCVNSCRPKLVGQTPHMSIFIRSHDVMSRYPIPWIFLSPETDDYLREIQEEEDERLKEYLTEEEMEDLFDEEAYHNLDT